MIQDIITYALITYSAGYTLFRLVRFFRVPAKRYPSACAGCAGCVLKNLTIGRTVVITRPYDRMVKSN